MLIACPGCHRQYDVGDMQPGAKVRCMCAELCTVPVPVARQVRMAHCSNCGATLSSGATRCEYCSADVLLGDRGLGEACPECFARMVKGARFCSSCGTAIRVEATLRVLARRACPRCSGELAQCQCEGLSFVECTSCGGIWLDERAFELFTERHQAADAAAFISSRRPRKRQQTSAVVRYLACPECGGLMNRKNFGLSGVIIDWCGGHGYWFDTHELEEIHRFIQQGGLRGRDAAGYRVARPALEPKRGHSAASARVSSPFDMLDMLGGILRALFLG